MRSARSPSRSPPGAPTTTRRRRRSPTLPPGGRQLLVLHEPGPPEVDLVDFFLFDPAANRSGYCQYYASAMVMMARSVGLPARLAGASRRASGRRMRRSSYREANAHAGEIYFLDTGGRSSRRRSRSSRASPGSRVTAPSFRRRRSGIDPLLDGEVLRELADERCSARVARPRRGRRRPAQSGARPRTIRTRGPGTRSSSSSSWPAPCSWCGCGCGRCSVDGASCPRVTGRGGS